MQHNVIRFPIERARLPYYEQPDVSFPWVLMYPAMTMFCLFALAWAAGR